MGRIRLRLPEPFVNEQCQCPVSGNVAGCAETVHGNVEGNHQGLCILVEPQHGRQDAERSHNRTSRNARRGYHRYSQHEDEAGKHLEIIRNVLHHHEGQGAGHNLQGASGQMNGGAQGDDKSGDAFVHSVLYGLFQGDGNRGGR